MLRSTFVLTLLAAGFAGALWSRHVALLTYVWLALFRPIEWIWWDISALRPSLIAGLLLLVPSAIAGRFPNASHPLTVLMWLFTGAVLVAQVTSPFAGDWSWVDQFVRLVVVCGLAVTLLDTRQRLTQFVAVAAGSIAFFSGKAGVVSAMGGGVQFSDGQAGSFIDNNGYALATAMALPLMLAASRTLRLSDKVDRVARWGFLAAIPLSIFTVIGTMSRSGLLAVVALAVVFASLQRRPMLWLAGLVLAAFLVYRFAPMPEGYLDRVETIRTYEEVGDESAISRLHFWRVAGAMASQNPLGVGLRRFDRAYDDYDFLDGEYGRRRSVHSSHFQVLAEMGYFGFLVWCGLFAYSGGVCLQMRRARRYPQLSPEDCRFYETMSTALIAALAAFVVGGAFIALANNDLTWLLFASVAALHRQFTAQRHAAVLAAMASPTRAAAVRPRRAAIA